MQRWWSKLLVGAVAVAMAAYAADWIVLQVRLRNGSAQSSVVVEHSFVIHEKNGKLEYIYDQPQPAPCVRSLFPHQGEPPCWWLTRHPEQQQSITAN